MHIKQIKDSLHPAESSENFNEFYRPTILQSSFTTSKHSKIARLASHKMLLSIGFGLTCTRQGIFKLTSVCERDRALDLQSKS